jgi:hypothetical protein
MSRAQPAVDLAVTCNSGARLAAATLLVKHLAQRDTISSGSSAALPQLCPLVIRGASCDKDRNSQTCDVKSGHAPQKGLDTKTNQMNDRQLYSDLDYICKN